MEILYILLGMLLGAVGVAALAEDMATLLSPLTTAVAIIFVSLGVASLLMLWLIKPRKKNKR